MDILKRLKELKEEYKKDGFIIDGVFGSFARGEKNFNDIDLLYHVEKKFIEKYRGFIVFKRLEEIKRALSNELGKEVDLAPINNLSKTAKKYIFKELKGI
ncbi:MAG: nucleotidyltransferase domain-containing protein [Epsilonproteobacteria bacterium]|nr:nucleotidyltransferase domain-containing protein [Campylobacterota bacterium]